MMVDKERLGEKRYAEKIKGRRVCNFGDNFNLWFIFCDRHRMSNQVPNRRILRWVRDDPGMVVFFARRFASGVFLPSIIFVANICHICYSFEEKVFAKSLLRNHRSDLCCGNCGVSVSTDHTASEYRGISSSGWILRSYDSHGSAKIKLGEEE